MTEQPAGPRCGNNPNVRLTPGDQRAVDDFKARLALRDRIADTLAATDGWRWVSDSDKARSSTYRGYQTRADAVLAVLPAPADRAALAAEAAIERVRSVLESEAVVGRSALDYRGLITSALMADQAPASDPSRMADEAQQPETQDATHEWFVETRMLDGRWSKYGAARDTAEDGRELFERDTASLTKPHAFRLVHATTTFAIEAEHEPAAVSQPGKEAPSDR